MSTGRVVLVVDGEPVYFLSDVMRGEDGQIKSAFVENGCWYMELTQNSMIAKDGQGLIRNTFAKPEYVEFPVPKGMRGDYNEVMGKIRESLGGNHGN